MPFVQRENISHFVRACQLSPLNLPDHDIFLTDDLYEAKDPAQVLQCITAFSRRANAVNSTAIPRAIGRETKAKSNAVSSPPIIPVKSPYARTPLDNLNRERTGSSASDSPPVWNPLAKGSYAAGRISPTKGLDSKSPQGNVSSWSRKGDQGNTAPAWNIHQYGYMGGASQGNQGVSFGARRQITAASPTVPSLADKERQRKEVEAEEERKRLEAEEAEQRRFLEAQAEEERARIAEEERWEEETRKAREREQEKELELERELERKRELEREREVAREEAEADRRRWDEEQRSWKGEEERKLEIKRPNERSTQRIVSDPRLQGQYLSQYKAGQQTTAHNGAHPPAQQTPEKDRIKELERQLEEAKKREQQHQVDMEEERRRNLPTPQRLTSSNYSTSPPTKDALPVFSSIGSLEDDWQESERQYLQGEYQNYADSTNDHSQPLKTPTRPSNPPNPSPAYTEKPESRPLPSPRPLPDPTAYTPGSNRTDRYLSSHPAPEPTQPTSHRPQDYSTTTEVDLENQRRKESQAKTKAGGWASKSLLEREMERERERQKEWEQAQKATAGAPRNRQEGGGPGQTWDVHQYGYMGGDSQNRGGPGLGVGGARRQIIGPRPPP